LDGGDDDAGAEEFAGLAPGGFEQDGFELREGDVEIFQGLLREFDAVNDEQNALGVTGLEETADEGGAEHGLAGACGHFEEELATALLIKLGRDGVEGVDLVAAEGEIGFERPEVIGRDDLAEQWPGRLEVFEKEALEVLLGREPLDAISILIGTGEIPEPVFFAVGEDDERGVQVLSVAASLLPGVIGVNILAFGFEDAEDGATLGHEDVIGAAGMSVEFKTDLVRIEKIPAAEFECFIDQHPREGLILTIRHRAEHSKELGRGARKVTIARRQKEPGAKSSEAEKCRPAGASAFDVD